MAVESDLAVALEKAKALEKEGHWGWNDKNDKKQWISAHENGHVVLLVPGEEPKIVYAWGNGAEKGS